MACVVFFSYLFCLVINCLFRGFVSVMFLQGREKQHVFLAVIRSIIAVPAVEMKHAVFIAAYSSEKRFNV